MLNQFRTFVQHKRTLKQGEGLYQQMLEPSKLGAVLSICALPDTLTGRFAVLSLCASVALHQVKNRTELERGFVGALVADLDLTFREKSLGDASVKKQIKNHASAFYGRLRAFERVLNNHESAQAVLQRNLYADKPTHEQRSALPHMIPKIRKFIQQEGLCAGMGFDDKDVVGLVSGRRKSSSGHGHRHVK